MLSFYDLLMLVVFAGAILFGLWKGLAWQVASLAAVFFSYFVALTFRGQVAGLVPAEPPWNQFIAMAVLYLGSSLLIWLAFGAVRRNIERMQLKEFDRQAGALVGALKGALLCMVITMFAVTLPGDSARRAVIQSRSGNFIASSINRFSAVVPRELHAVLDPYFTSFNQRLNDPLPPQTADSAGGSFLGAFSSSPATTTDANRVGGSINLPVSVSRNPQGGFQVQVDSEKLWNQGVDAVRNNLHGMPPGTPNGQPPASPQTGWGQPR